MKKFDDGGHVYAVATDGMGEWAPIYQEGITQRDWLAGLAMQGILANSAECCVNLTPKQLAHLSYDLADTLITQGKKE